MNICTHVYNIDNGDSEILIHVRYIPILLIGNTLNEVICRVRQRCQLDILCASLGLSRQGVHVLTRLAGHVVCHFCKSTQSLSRLVPMARTA